MVYFNIKLPLLFLNSYASLNELLSAVLSSIQYHFCPNNIQCRLSHCGLYYKVVVFTDSRIEDNSQLEASVVLEEADIDKNEDTDIKEDSALYSYQSKPFMLRKCQKHESQSNHTSM